MVFSSLLFVFFFFPVNMLIYHLAPDLKHKNRVMLIFSLIFYAWSGPIYLLLLISMAFVDWRAALAMEHAHKKKGRKRALILGVGFNLTLLGIFKYLTFILENVNYWFHVPETVIQIALPIGISFYTFQLISYLVDVYRKEVHAQRHFGLLLLYVSLYHQCIAGPIVRYETVAQELTERRTKSTDVLYGIRRFTVGLAKKALLANHCGALADTFLVATSDAAGASILATRPALSILIGSICFTLQIYLDFSAYSDMAIGMGRMLGFHYLENFNYPYCANSIRDFWHRWHISLSTFFRDYVYIPLGGSRCSVGRHIFNLFVVWACTGFWHGASWNFVLWGLLYFVFQVLEKYILPDFPSYLPRFLQHLYVLLVVNFGYMLFRCDNIAWLGVGLKGLFCLNGNAWVNLETLTTLKANWFFLVIACLACTPIVRNIGLMLERSTRRHAGRLFVWQWIQAAIPVVLVIFSTAALVGQSYNPFLYFRF